VILLHVEAAGDKGESRWNGL